MGWCRGGRQTWRDPDEAAGAGAGRAQPPPGRSGCCNVLWRELDGLTPVSVVSFSPATTLICDFALCDGASQHRGAGLTRLRDAARRSAGLLSGVVRLSCALVVGLWSAARVRGHHAAPHHAACSDAQCTMRMRRCAGAQAAGSRSFAICTAAADSFPVDKSFSFLRHFADQQTSKPLPPPPPTPSQPVPLLPSVPRPAHLAPDAFPWRKGTALIRI